METAAISASKPPVDGQLIQIYQPFSQNPGQASLPKTLDSQALLVFEQQMQTPPVQGANLEQTGINRSGFEEFSYQSSDVCSPGEIRTDGNCQLNDGRGDMKTDGIIGDNILEGLDAIRNESNNRFDNIQAMLDKDNLGTADLLQTQLDIQLWSLHHDVYSKITGTFDRNVDTLLKAQ